MRDVAVRDLFGFVRDRAHRKGAILHKVPYRLTRTRRRRGSALRAPRRTAFETNRSVGRSTLDLGAERLVSDQVFCGLDIDVQDGGSGGWTARASPSVSITSTTTTGSVGGSVATCVQSDLSERGRSWHEVDCPSTHSTRSRRHDHPEPRVARSRAGTRPWSTATAMS